MIDLSIVIPIKEEQDNLRPLHERITVALQPLGKSYEIVFVDDGSHDQSWQVLQELARQDSRVKVVSLQRNYGQTPATKAGIDHSLGQVIITMDGDLQNDPADSPRLLEKLDEGYDAVLGERANRKDKLLLRKVPSWIANWVIRKVTGITTRDLGCTIRAIKRDVAVALPLYGEMHRFIPVLIQQQGAKVTQITVGHHPRVAGQTKYNLSRTVRVILDLITVKFLHVFVTRPMHAFGLMGLLSLVLGMLTLFVTIGMRLFSQIDMTGNPLLLLSVLFVLLGVQFISLGLLGEMLTRTYFESQSKSQYVIRGTLNVSPSDQRRAA